MSWKARKRKAFMRQVSALKQNPIFPLDNYLAIDNTVGGGMPTKEESIRSAKEILNYLITEREIKYPDDIDDYINPDLSIYPIYEKDPLKYDVLTQKTLLEIGLEWKNRLLEEYPDHKNDYILILYFNEEGGEWILDFFNKDLTDEDLNELENWKHITVIHRYKKISN